MQNKIDALFQLWKDHPGAGGQILVMQKGEVLFEKCYGFANIETQTPMTPDSMFHMASVTKPFTAMSMLILHERGLVNVFDDVRKYIPDLIRFPEPLTIKQMLNHVSGLQGYYEMMRLGGRSIEDHYAQHEVRRLVARQTRLCSAPGSEFVYTNANYMLCATIIERVSGMSFNQFCIENILRPLGMEKSFIRDDPHVIVPNKVSSYHDDGYEYTNAILTFGIYGGTSLHSTAREIALFMEQFKNPTLISRKTMDEIMLNPPLIHGKRGNYGCGVRVDELLGHRYIHHGGVNAGYRTVGQIYPEDDLIITACTNTYNIPIETAARDIARIVLGLPERVQKDLSAFEQAEPVLENMDGMWYCDRNGNEFNIEIRDGKVYMDGTYMTPVRGSLFKKGRCNIWLNLGQTVAVAQNGNIMQLRKLSAYSDQSFLEACAGHYYCPDVQGHYDIFFRDGGLVMEHIRFGCSPLHYLGEDQFLCRGFDLQFVKDAAGAVTGYKITGERIDMFFEKVQ